MKDRNNLHQQKLVDGWEEAVADDSSCHANVDSGTPLPSIQLHNKTKKLLQFDKSHRPAYYGTLSSERQVIDS